MLALRSLVALPRAGGAACAVSLAREFGSSAAALHVEPVQAENDAPAQKAGMARWQRELGVIRNDWT